MHWVCLYSLHHKQFLIQWWGALMRLQQHQATILLLAWQLILRTDQQPRRRDAHHARPTQCPICRPRVALDVIFLLRCNTFFFFWNALRCITYERGEEGVDNKQKI